MTTSTCPGCGLELAVRDGPTHAYIGASPACWALFGELLVRGASRLATDAYAVQHPGVPGRKATQSVALHLAGLCLAFEHGLGDADHARLLDRLTRWPPAFGWLEPPRPNGTLTVADVLGGMSDEAYARDVWSAWAAHHDTVRAWVASSLA